MEIAAKRKPTQKALEKAYSEGFDYAELYLTPDHLDNMDRSIAAVKDADIDIVAAHTPHVSLEQSQYIDRTHDLVKQLGCLMVFHSASIFINHAIQYSERYEYPLIAFEHNPGFSRRGIQNLVLDRGKKLVLDTAHLFIGAERFLTDLEHLSTYAEHIHLCDSTPQVDGVPFGDGVMDMEKTACTIAKSDYDGYVVLEVMPDHQEDAKNMVETYINASQ